jgi:putative spermidine/putrescine transport system permease protein
MTVADAGDVSVAASPGRARKERGSWRLALLLLPSILWMGFVFALPIGNLLRSAFVLGDGSIGLANFVTILQDDYYRTSIWNTLSFSFLVSFLCVVIAYPFVLAVIRMPALLQTTVLILTLLPLTSSVIVKAFGWTIMFGSTGIVNQILMAVGLVDAPVRLLFTMTALYVGAVNLFLPFVVLPIFAVARMISPDIYAAAETLGAGPFYRFFHITVPLTAPGVIAGASIAFSISASAYVVPTLLTGDRFPVISRQIFNEYMITYNEPIGAAIAVVLLATTLFILGLTSYLAHNGFGRRAA